VEPARLLALDDLFAVIADKFPVSPGHALVIARRPVAQFRQLTATEKARLLVWIDWAQEHLASKLSPAPNAFNLGVNDGPAAGQTMAQFHFHVIPRYAGDVPDPRGGIRHVILPKARYWQDKPVSGAGYSAHNAPPSKQARTPAAGNALSARANRCLSTAGIPAEREAVLHALRTGALRPFFRPPLYGKRTHSELCRWTGTADR
jgi:diadenosine tetraphosphate (Ap4A) HIT family hydrolase